MKSLFRQEFEKRADDQSRYYSILPEHTITDRKYF